MGEYLTYINSTLKTGMLVRSLDNTAMLWKGDICVNLGRDEPNSTSTHLWCYRLQIPLVVDDLTNLEIMGVTNYPGEYASSGGALTSFRAAGPDKRRTRILDISEISGCLE